MLEFLSRAVQGPLSAWIGVVAVLAVGGLVLEFWSPGTLRRRLPLVLLMVAALFGIGALLAVQRLSTSYDGCPRVAEVRWDNGHEAWGEDSLVLDLLPCETLMITGPKMDTPAGRCDETGYGLCVAVWHPAKVVTRVVLSNLSQGETWWAVTWAGMDQAIEDKLHDPELGWFARRNCGPTGCPHVQVLMFGDGNAYLGDQTRLPPP